MKKLIALLAVGACVAALAGPATAAKAKKTTLYLHGNAPVGDYAELVSNTADGTTMVMDTTEPSSPVPSSFGIYQPYNESCTGNPLFPSWEGKVTGTIVGPIKINLHLLTAPSTIRVRLWNDIPFSSCTSGAAGVDAYQDPKFEKTVEVPAGHSETQVVFKNKKLPVQANLILELSQTGTGSQGRVFYDSTDFASNVEFMLGK